MSTGVGRQELERDYDRILFCTPTRRLADKTRVFPMEENTSIRNRLTHSHEVSNLARSIGVRIAFDEAERVFGDDHETLQVKRNVPGTPRGGRIGPRPRQSTLWPSGRGGHERVVFGPARRRG